MLQYFAEIIVWTFVIYLCFELIKIFIYRFIISKEKIIKLKKLGYIKIGKCSKNKNKNKNKKRIRIKNNNNKIIIKN